MIIRIPEKRRDGKSSFLKLIAYTIIRDEDKPDTPIEPEHPGWRRPGSKGEIFNHLVNYITRNPEADIQHILHADPNGYTQVLFDGVICETNCFNIATAPIEMNAVALQNVRCKDPVLHYILSWPTEDNPSREKIFESVRHSLNALGMLDHQYVAAIHTDTNNIHCHVSANRIHPETYKTANDSFTKIRLQYAARELELKYNWTHTNGFFAVNENKEIVRAKRDNQPAPAGARSLEYYADVESLHTYATTECGFKIDEAMSDPNMSWRDIHCILVRAGLELKPKGKGLAIYSIDNPELPPVKASSVHPDLTLSCLEKDLGKFQPLNEVGVYTTDNTHIAKNAIVHEFRYEPTLHARDMNARLERRLERAAAREDLKSRYKDYKAEWVRPRMDREAIRLRYQNESKRFAWRKNHARVAINDPLLRKLTYNIIEVERMKSMAALRIDIRNERAAFKADPANRRMSYREWVSQQAIKQDQAAITQLRGWAHRMKRNARTGNISSNAIVCAVADDTPAFKLDGYSTAVTRDGTIQYFRDGVVQLQDKGSRIEINDYHANGGEHIAGGMALAENKSGEHLIFSGEPAFIGQACEMVEWFNDGGDKPLPLTDPEQRVMAGYDTVYQPQSIDLQQQKSEEIKSVLSEKSKLNSGYHPK
ncbi:hypothetical protein Xmau_03860 [Xenorhabdus mauleonii]|uniref:Relaxase/Mobilisation nuclease domain-containing protein n=1 Tax=Xenorhabdus mauleonii TaxID=351675 RepID=A0A1I3V4R0_9GAMM|nr:TraI/MobA(P) family conjugative relaxase [Xenorhabdus mauleonii]PHM37642.1 hypothetical protein Xmau_03860 [Xenorhabdus mauleonii]SFJ90644.1 Relaxase/Mobilisation nuclease domain-containing protein [Xenorhabdus mauleonii]